MSRELPKELIVTENHQIAEWIGDGRPEAQRVLLSPSECYLNCEIVELERVIQEIVKRYNLAPRVFQIHYQSKTDPTDTQLIEQNEIFCREQMNLWIKNVVAANPLPECFQWLICNQKSPLFVKTPLSTEDEMKEEG